MGSMDFKSFDFQNCYILCICEGNTEVAIMDTLLDNELLLFDRDVLIDNKVHRIRNSKKIIEKFLQFNYSKEVLIFRIIDSKKERFNLKKPYDKYRVYNFYTRNEIEYIHICYDGYLDEYNKVKSKTKASLFYLSKNKGYKKSYEYTKNYFKDLQKLRDSLKQAKVPNEYGLYDLLA